MATPSSLPLFFAAASLLRLLDLYLGNRIFDSDRSGTSRALSSSPLASLRGLVLLALRLWICNGEKVLFSGARFSYKERFAPGVRKADSFPFRNYLCLLSLLLLRCLC